MSPEHCELRKYRLAALDRGKFPNQQTTDIALFLNGDKIREESETKEGAERCPSR
jgi:hypothetical protein